VAAPTSFHDGSFFEELVLDAISDGVAGMVSVDHRVYEHGVILALRHFRHRHVEGHPDGA